MIWRLWPINLVRDFRQRTHRLLKTAHVGAITVFHLPQVLNESKQPGTTLRRFGAWSHLCIVQIFDLLGGPELAQFFMHLITHTTPLTPTETEMMKAILGEDALRYQDIRVAQGGLMKYVFQRNGNLAFATWHTINLPEYHGRSQDIRTRENLPIVVHELTHVYQYHVVGSRYMTEAIYVLIKFNRDCYAYGGEEGLMCAQKEGTRFASFNREQQAQIVQDYFSRLQDGKPIERYLPFIEQVRAGQL